MVNDEIVIFFICDYVFDLEVGRLVVYVKLVKRN